MSEAMQAYSKARTHLILDQPFFGTLALRLTPIEDETIDTAGTDGQCIKFNPKWFVKLSEAQRVGLIAHEVMHVVLLHMLRRMERNHKRWNIAGGCGEVFDHGSLSDGTGTGKFESDIIIAIQQAAEVAKGVGKLPGHMQELVEKALAPKVDWKMVLARFLRANNKSDFSWAKPNRRFIAQGMYLPSMWNPCLGEIAIVGDSSGSCREYLEQFTGEITSILHDLNPELVRFIQCDTEVHDDTTYTREDLPLKVKYGGGGGTAFGPAIDYVSQKYPNVCALVYLTDLEAYDFGNPPDFPVLWVTTEATEAPYGQVVQM